MLKHCCGSLDPRYASHRAAMWKCSLNCTLSRVILPRTTVSEHYDSGKAARWHAWPCASWLRSPRWRRPPASYHRSQRFVFVACSAFGTPNYGNVTARQKRSLRFLHWASLAEANSITVRTLTFFFSTAKKDNSRRTFPTISSSIDWETRSWKHFRRRILTACCFE